MSADNQGLVKTYNFASISDNKSSREINNIIETTINKYFLKTYINIKYNVVVKVDQTLESISWSNGISTIIIYYKYDSKNLSLDIFTFSTTIETNKMFFENLVEKLIGDVINKLFLFEDIYIKYEKYSNRLSELSNNFVSYKYEKHTTKVINIPISSTTNKRFVLLYPYIIMFGMTLRSSDNGKTIVLKDRQTIVGDEAYIFQYFDYYYGSPADITSNTIGFVIDSYINPLKFEFVGFKPKKRFILSKMSLLVRTLKDLTIHLFDSTNPFMPVHRNMRIPRGGIDVIVYNDSGTENFIITPNLMNLKLSLSKDKLESNDVLKKLLMEAYSGLLVHYITEDYENDLYDSFNKKYDYVKSMEPYDFAINTIFGQKLGNGDIYTKTSVQQKPQTKKPNQDRMINTFINEIKKIKQKEPNSKSEIKYIKAINSITPTLFEMVKEKQQEKQDIYSNVDLLVVTPNSYFKKFWNTNDRTYFQRMIEHKINNKVISSKPIKSNLISQIHDIK